VAAPSAASEQERGKRADRGQGQSGDVDDRPDPHTVRSDIGDRDRAAAPYAAATAAATTAATSFGFYSSTAAGAETALRERLDEWDDGTVARRRLGSDGAFTGRRALDRVRQLLDAGEDPEHSTPVLDGAACPVLHGTLLHCLDVITRSSRP
jgi:hypothetical protein